jgi:SAM-dependent methyltransferase
LRESLLEILGCPGCRGALRLEADGPPAEDGHVLEGALVCAECGARFAVARGVPRMQRELDDMARERTTESFGFEWNRWPRFGWEPGEVEGESQTYSKKTLLADEELRGRVALEAGCGNGRYLNQARNRGAEVVGIDLSGAVDAAFANTRGDGRIHVVQGDIFNPPFRRHVFDVMYTIGVLMHTGNARRAFDALVPLVRPGGLVCVHVYKRGTPLYEWVDTALRGRTTRWSRERLLRFSERAARLAGLLPPRILSWVNSVVRVQAHPSIVYDWYATEIATHHTYDEVRDWFRERGVDVLADNDRARPVWKQRLHPDLSLTVKGLVPVAGDAAGDRPRPEALLRGSAGS